MGFGVAHHLLDLVIRQAARRLDDNGLLLAGRLVLGGDVEDAVGVDVKAHFDLRHAARRGRNVGQVEAAERLVLRGLLALPLQHVNGHRRLIVVGGGEHLGLLGGNGGVLLDQHAHDLAQRLNAERKGRHVEQQHVLDVAGEHRRLDGRADGHRLVGIDVAAGLLVEEALDLLLHQGHARLATDQDHVVDVADTEARVLDGRAAGADGAIDQLLNQGFELGPGELEHQVLGAALVGSDVGQVDFRLLAVGQLDLGLLGCLLEALQGQGIVVQVDAVLLFELIGQVVDDREIEILTAKEGVAVGGEHLELVLAVDLSDLDDGDVEGAATQVIDGDLGVATLLVEAIGQGRSGGLVDDALHVEAGNAAGILGGLALRVVEVGGHRDHRVGDGFAEILLGGLLHLPEHLSRNLRRRELVVLDADPGIAVGRIDDLVGHHLDVLLHHLVGEFAADEALDREQGVVGIGHRLPLGVLANEDFAIAGVGDDGGGRAVPFRVFDDFRIAPVEHSHA